MKEAITIEGHKVSVDRANPGEKYFCPYLNNGVRHELIIKYTQNGSSFVHKPNTPCLGSLDNVQVLRHMQKHIGIFFKEENPYSWQQYMMHIKENIFIGLSVILTKDTTWRKITGEYNRKEKALTWVFDSGQLGIYSYKDITMDQLIQITKAMQVCQHFFYHRLYFIDRTGVLFYLIVRKVYSENDSKNITYQVKDKGLLETRIPYISKKSYPDAFYQSKKIMLWQFIPDLAKQNLK